MPRKTVTLSLLACALALSACQSPSCIAEQSDPVEPLTLPDLGLDKREPNLRQRLRSLWTESPATATTPSASSTPASTATPPREPL